MIFWLAWLKHYNVLTSQYCFPDPVTTSCESPFPPQSPLHYLWTADSDSAPATDSTWEPQPRCRWLFAD